MKPMGVIKVDARAGQPRASFNEVFGKDPRPTDFDSTAANKEFVQIDEYKAKHMENVKRY